MRDRFAHFAASAARLSGTYWAFLLALLVITVWMITGPFFKFSDTWQLVINTGTTIVTFLMVFLIQNAQNRESRATQLKLDELLRAIDRASNRLIDIEEGNEEDLERLEEVFRRRARHAQHNGSSTPRMQEEQDNSTLPD